MAAVLIGPLRECNDADRSGWWGAWSSIMIVNGASTWKTAGSRGYVTVKSNKEGKLFEDRGEDSEEEMVEGGGNRYWVGGEEYL